MAVCAYTLFFTTNQLQHTFHFPSVFYWVQVQRHPSVLCLCVCVCAVICAEPMPVVTDVVTVHLSAHRTLLCKWLFCIVCIVLRVTDSSQRCTVCAPLTKRTLPLYLFDFSCLVSLPLHLPAVGPLKPSRKKSVCLAEDHLHAYCRTPTFCKCASSS